MEVKYDKIGIGYNQTRQADEYLTERFLHHLRPRKEGHYLDIGCGTGNYTNAIHKRGFNLIGIDPSQEMINQAKIKNQQIDWRLGTAEHFDLPAESIDGIIVSLTIHHWTDLTKAFSQLNEVLKHNGRIVIFTSTPDQMNGFWLNHYFPKMLNDSIEQMPSFETIESAMTSNGLKISAIENYSIKPDLMDKFLYCGKQSPELYLDENIRHGISSFSSLANRNEVEKGLRHLEADIGNGEIKSIIESYNNDLGDYLFIIGEK